MARFIAWFNDTVPGGPKAIPQPPVRSALAHLYFESIHPFEDGKGFTGGMNARKYVALTGVSKATATRDLLQLARSGALTPLAGGRSTRYELDLA